MENLKTKLQIQIDKDQLMKEVSYAKLQLSLTRVNNPTRVYDFSDADSFPVQEILKDLEEIKNLADEIGERVKKEVGIIHSELKS